MSPSCLNSFLLLTGLLVVSCQAQDSNPDPLSLLKSASDHYFQASSYHIEAVRERTFSNELERNWQKMFLTAIVAPGGRYRYEGRSGSSWAVLVSDGKTKWDHHLNEHLYTEVAASAADPNGRIMPMEEWATREAKDMVTELRTLAIHAQSPRLLPAETIESAGHKVDCYVIRFVNRSSRFDPDFKSEETVWIAKSNNAFAKTLKHSNTYVIHASGVHTPMLEDTTTEYPVVEFDAPAPETSFTFSPPAEAKRVDAFPEISPRVTAAPPSDLVGTSAPDLQLRAPDGKLTTLTSLRGKPIFIEFWSTWCEPCLELMPELKKLYAETAAKGLVWISIDNDEDPRAAASFLSQEHVPWPNYHDDDGALGKAFHRQGIPLGVLINVEGKVTFCKSGYEISELRAALAKLDPLFDTKPSSPASPK